MTNGRGEELIMHVLGSTHTGNSAIQEENATHLSKVMEGEAIKIMHYYIYIYQRLFTHRTKCSLLYKRLFTQRTKC